MAGDMIAMCSGIKISCMQRVCNMPAPTGDKDWAVVPWPGPWLVQVMQKRIVLTQRHDCVLAACFSTVSW